MDYLDEQILQSRSKIHFKHKRDGDGDSIRRVLLLKDGIMKVERVGGSCGGGTRVQMHKSPNATNIV